MFHRNRVKITFDKAVYSYLPRRDKLRERQVRHQISLLPLVVMYKGGRGYVIISRYYVASVASHATDKIGLRGKLQANLFCTVDNAT